MVASRNYTPAACKGGTPALYCAPNTGGSDGNSPGTGSPPECAACTCNADYQPPDVKKCSIIGDACTSVCGVPGCDTGRMPGPAAPAPNGCSVGRPDLQLVPVGSPACTAQLWDPVEPIRSRWRRRCCRTRTRTATSAATTTRSTRSAAPRSGRPFTYPRTNLGDVYAANKTASRPYTQLGDFGTGPIGYSTSSGCPTVGTTVAIPRHYYTIDSVQFCNAVDGTVNGQWKGFGTGVCKPVNDLTTFKNVKYGQFHRSDLVNDGRTYAYIDQATQLPMSRTYAQEIINYANWYAYYRLRSHSAKTTSSLAFNLLDDSYRVGFHTLGTEPVPTGSGVAPTWVDVKDFNLAQRIRGGAS